MHFSPLYSILLPYLDEELQEMLDEADADRDGIVNIDDFMKIMTERPPNAHNPDQ